MPALTTVGRPMLQIAQETLRLMLEILRGTHGRVFNRENVILYFLAYYS